MTDRLTADPDIPGPFAPIAYSLPMDARELGDFYPLAEDLLGRADVPSRTSPV